MKNYDVIVIGAGIMGLSAAYYCLKENPKLKILILEKDRIPGGMAAHFNFGDISLERFYHFICKTDIHTFKLLKSIGIQDKLRWVNTSSGYYINDKLFKFGDPISLLRFSPLSLFERFRYGVFALYCSMKRNWRDLDDIDAVTWIQKWCGKNIYTKLWNPLFKLKFHEFTNNISAAWIWSRIHRLSKSRKNMFQEELGFIEGGTETLINSLVTSLSSKNVEILYGSDVKEIIKDGKLFKITNKEKKNFFGRKVFSSMPLANLPNISPSLSEELIQKYSSIDNIGVVCVVLKLNKRVTPHFWVNICNGYNIPGIIEFSNLRNFGEDNHIVYIPYYMPTSHQLWLKDNDYFWKESFSYIQKINSEIKTSDLNHHFVGRLQHAQPICDPGFSKKIPDIETSLEGLFIADTCFYYPEDRGISESINIGEQVAKKIIKDL